MQYWLCEHVKLIEPEELERIPRYRRWRLRDMGDALKVTALKDIRPNQVRAIPIRATPEEEAFLIRTGDIDPVSEDQQSSEYETDNGLVDKKDGCSDSEGVDNTDGELVDDGDNEQCDQMGGHGSPSMQQGPFGTDDGTVDGAVRSRIGGLDKGTGRSGSSVKKNTSLLHKVSNLETQVSMLEAELDETRSDARKWEHTATSMKEMNDELLEEINRLQKMSGVGILGWHGSVVVEGLDDMKRKLHEEMRETIELRAELRKSEVEIDKLQQSKTLLIAELEEERQKTRVVNQTTHNVNEVVFDVHGTSLGCNANVENNDEIVDIDVEVRDISLEGDAKIGDQVRTTNPLAAPGFITPVIPLKTRPPFVDNEPSWALVS